MMRDLLVSLADPASTGLRPRAPARASLRRRLSAECFEASPPQLPWASRAGCWLPGSTSEPSRSLISSMSLARGTHHHVLDLALLHPTAAQLGLRGSAVHTYGHVLPGPSAVTSGTHHSETSAHASLSCCFVTPVTLELSATHRPCPPAVGHDLLQCVLGSQPLAVFFFFTALWHVFHPPHLHDFNANFSFRITAAVQSWNQLNSDVTGFGNTQASRGKRNHHLPRTPGCPLLCRCTESAAPLEC